MNKAIAALLIILVAGTALANGTVLAEKTPDTVNGVLQNGSRAVATITLTESSPTWDRGYVNNEPVSLECDFPLIDSGNDGQFFDLIKITSTDDQPIEIIVDGELTTINDTYMTLFCEGFDPALPLENAVFSDDDDGDGLKSAFVLEDNIILPAGTDYWLVLTTYSPDHTGDIVLNLSDNLLYEHTVASEEVSWDHIKGLYR